MPETEPFEIKIIVKENGIDVGCLAWINSDSLEMIWFNGLNNANATYFDYNLEGRTINQGDYVNLIGLQP